MLKEIKGTIIRSEAKYIAHQCNCFSITASGVARTIFDEYTHADVYADRPEDRLPRGQYNEGQNPGDIVVCGDGKLHRYVINMMAQVYPGGTRFPDSELDGEKARQNLFMQCLAKINKIENIESIAFPKGIGCGLAGGDWFVYETLIERFSEVNPDIDVFIVEYDLTW